MSILSLVQRAARGRVAQGRAVFRSGLPIEGQIGQVSVVVLFTLVSSYSFIYLLVAPWLGIEPGPGCWQCRSPATAPAGSPTRVSPRGQASEESSCSFHRSGWNLVSASCSGTLGSLIRRPREVSCVKALLALPPGVMSVVCGADAHGGCSFDIKGESSVGSF